MAELAGKHALVTGGGTGIGMGIARQLLKAGATVTISGRREDVLLDATLADVDHLLFRINIHGHFQEIGIEEGYPSLDAPGHGGFIGS